MAKRGRPQERLYPPKIDATMDELASAALNAPPPQGKLRPKEYHCGACGRAVHYPEILYRDGRCEECHA